MQRHLPPRSVRTTGALCLFTVAAAASAAESTQAPDAPADQAAFGVAAVTGPRYAGSDRTFVQILPVIAIQKGPWFIDTLRGLGAQYQTESGFSISEALHYDFGRVDRDSTFRPGSRTLRGMGDVAGSVVSRTIVAQQFNAMLSASAEAEYSLKDGTHRARYRAGVEVGLWQSETDSVAVNADLHAGNRAFDRAYFGVSPVQSRRSGYAAYQADAGLYAYSGSATWTHVFSPHWSSNLVLQGTHYMGKAGDSPLVKRHTALGTALAVNYSL
ncbi:MipA/OmpV family protein [Luteibacter flocculans]|uniref:MipA/OmpV family protein n=1 Tax=Luteibacter flocculans TaxID=2780091 RepID=A0ABY4T3Z7_9GAMM|nr:MipA/OmpV family protein [Luteibacter flocculans]URL58999.1 MipA/OmpV family protein [Luteibacter flocculans]